MNRAIVICVTVILVALLLATWAVHRIDAQAETRRVEYCMRFAPYATLPELSDCLASARG